MNTEATDQGAYVFFDIQFAQKSTQQGAVIRVPAHCSARACSTRVLCELVTCFIPARIAMASHLAAIGAHTVLQTGITIFQKSVDPFTILLRAPREPRKDLYAPGGTPTTRENTRVK